MKEERWLKRGLLVIFKARLDFLNAALAFARDEGEEEEIVCTEAMISNTEGLLEEVSALLEGGGS